jgi:hypothetical protein
VCCVLASAASRASMCQDLYFCTSKASKLLSALGLCDSVQHVTGEKIYRSEKELEAG